MPNDIEDHAGNERAPLDPDIASRLAWVNRSGITPAQLQAAERVTRAHAARMGSWLRQVNGQGGEGPGRISGH